MMWRVIILTLVMPWAQHAYAEARASAVTPPSAVLEGTQAQASPHLLPRLVLDSGYTVKPLLALYAAQGCKDCPASQRLLNRALKDTGDGIWEYATPVAFHVDYWDYLGWADPYAQAAFSQRQRAHRAARHIREAYTPAFMLQGLEWLAPFALSNDADLIAAIATMGAPQSGNTRIQATLSTAQLFVTVETPDYEGKELHIALLSRSLITDITSGVNQGQTLTETFTVRHHLVRPLYAESVEPMVPDYVFDGVAIWVEDALTPVQSVGGWVIPPL